MTRDHADAARELNASDPLYGVSTTYYRENGRQILSSTSGISSLTRAMSLFDEQTMRAPDNFWNEVPPPGPQVTRVVVTLHDEFRVISRYETDGSVEVLS